MACGPTFAGLLGAISVDRVTGLIVWQDPVFYSMVIMISFGATLGTVLTLGVVPGIYSLFFCVAIPTKR